MSPSDGGAEHGVGHGVGHGVAIGVAGEAHVALDRDAAEDHRSRGGEAVRIVSDAGAGHAATTERERRPAGRGRAAAAATPRHPHAGG